MNAEQLFEALGEIDERFIEEAAEPLRRRGWRITAVAAAAAAVIVGSVWFSVGLFRPEAPAPQDLAAPMVTMTPTAPPGTPEPIPDGTDSGQTLPGGTVQIPDAPPAEQTPTQPTTPQVPDLGSGGSGSWLPNLGFGIPGFGFQGSDAPGSGSDAPGKGNGSPSGGSVGPTLPGSGTLFPPMGGDSSAYRVEYRRSDGRDVLVLHSPVLGVPLMTKDITGQIVDGFYAGTFTGLPFGQSVYVELRVFEDGSYELSY